MAAVSIVTSESPVTTCVHWGVQNKPPASPVEYRAFLCSWSLFTLVLLRRLNVLVSLFLISAIVEGILVRLKCRVTVDN